MRLKMSKRGLLPLFAKVGAMGDLAIVAKKLVIAKKAVAEIVAIEDKLYAEKENTSVVDFELAMRETAYYAKVATNKAKDAQDVLNKLKPKVEAYQKDLKNAVD